MLPAGVCKGDVGDNELVEELLDSDLLVTSSDILDAEEPTLFTGDGEILITEGPSTPFWQDIN